MTEQIPPADMTLDELRLALAPLIAANAIFDGWGKRALSDAADTLTIPVDRAELTFPGGAVDMIDAWFDAVDQEMEQRLSREMLAGLKIRDRIRSLVQTRLEIMAPQREAVRRALVKLAMPVNLAAATRLGWRAADRMWRLAGDDAADFNHYTKRVSLAALYSSTLLVWIDDQSEGRSVTHAFLDRRIDGVMRFETAKRRFSSGHHFSPARLLGRLRYPEAR